MDDLYMKLISTPKMLLTVEEASNFFGLPTNLFENLILLTRKGLCDFPCMRINNNYKINRVMFIRSLEKKHSRDLQEELLKNNY